MNEHHNERVVSIAAEMNKEEHPFEYISMKTGLLPLSTPYTSGNRPKWEDTYAGNNGNILDKLPITGYNKYRFALDENKPHASWRIQITRRGS